jgi:hypothetical protein
MHAQFPFTHSAIAFLDLNTQSEARWLVFGRQTPYFLKPNTEEGKLYVGGISNLLHNLTASKIDNEKNYDFFKDQNFVVEMTNVTLSGTEVRQIINRADFAICRNKTFNLVQSNCYSASISILAYAIEVIANRTARNAVEEAKNNKSILAIKELLSHAIQDNFSIGVITHPFVTKQLKKVDRIIADRQLTNSIIFHPPQEQESLDSSDSSDEDNAKKNLNKPR